MIRVIRRCNDPPRQGLERDSRADQRPTHLGRCPTDLPIALARYALKSQAHVRKLCGNARVPWPLFKCQPWSLKYSSFNWFTPLAFMRI